MNDELEVYWVVLHKYGQPLMIVAGPFGSWSEADVARDGLETPSLSCSHEIRKSKIQLEEA